MYPNNLSEAKRMIESANDAISEAYADIDRFQQLILDSDDAEDKQIYTDEVQRQYKHINNLQESHQYAVGEFHRFEAQQRKSDIAKRVKKINIRF